MKKQSFGIILAAVLGAGSVHRHGFAASILQSQPIRRSFRQSGTVGENPINSGWLTKSTVAASFHMPFCHQAIVPTY